MDIQIDGNRSTSECWQAAQLISPQALPPISPEEEQVAKKLAISSEGYRRSKYAAELTKHQLEARALQVGKLVEAWLNRHNLIAQVEGVWLRTFQGKFRVEIRIGALTKLIFIEEDLINDLLDSGSIEAERSFDRLLTSNFSAQESAKAS